MLGWLVYTAAKPIAMRFLRDKSRSAVPAKKADSRGPNKAAVVAGLGALAAGVFFWRRRGDDGNAESGESGESSDS